MRKEQLTYDNSNDGSQVYAAFRRRNRMLIMSRGWSALDLILERAHSFLRLSGNE